MISNSYDGAESSTETTYDSEYYNHPGHIVTASSGDGGYGVEYPAASPDVTAVGGTTLTKTTSNPRGWTEAIWDEAGSGCSAYEPKPSWQTDTGCSKRAVADVSADANPNTGVAVYDNYSYAKGATTGWLVFGGTSLSNIIVASIYALGGDTANLDYGSYPYSHTSWLNNVTSGGSNVESGEGSCSPSYLCTAGPGYNGPTGWGTPIGDVAFGGASASPTVTGVNPSSGPATGGTVVTVTGTNFYVGGSFAVDFGGSAATNVSVSSPTQLTATAPAGSGTVNVTVSTPGGTSAAGAADDFTYTPLDAQYCDAGSSPTESSSASTYSGTCNPIGTTTGDVPTTWTPGQSQTVSITLVNNGSTTWTTGSGGSNTFHLGAHFSTVGGGLANNYSDWLTDQRVNLPSSVAPGQSVTLVFSLTAPNQTGNLVLEFEMVEEDVAWFAQYSDSTASVALALSAQYCDAGSSPTESSSASTYSGTCNPIGTTTGDVPTTWTPGQSQTVSITLVNNGSTTWTTGSGGSNTFHLGAHFSTVGGGLANNYSDWLTDQRINLPSSVAPGQSVTLVFSLTAPNQTGNLVLEFEMVEEDVAWFAQYSDSTASVALALSAQYCDAGSSPTESSSASTYSGTCNPIGTTTGDVPTTWTPGQSQTVSITLVNNGSTTWTTGSGGSNTFHLGAHFSTVGGGLANNYSDWLTDQRINLPSSVAPGQSVTLVFSLTAPNQTGNLVLEFEMVEEDVAWFAQYSDSTASVEKTSG